MQKLNIQKLKTRLLCATIACSLATAHVSWANVPNTGASNTGLIGKIVGMVTRNVPGGDKITEIVICAIIVATLNGLVNLFLLWLNKETSEMEKIKSWVEINKIMRDELDYMRANRYDKATIKALEKRYLESCLIIDELQKKYYAKYVKNPVVKNYAT